MKIGDQFYEKIRKKLPTAVDAGAESMAKSINDHVDTLVDNGRKYNYGKYENKYSKSHRTVRQRLKYQTKYVDLQMARKSVAQRVLTKTGLGIRRISFKPMWIRDSLTSDTLFYYHNWGLGLNPRRQLFPDTKGGMAGGIKKQMNASVIDGANELDPADTIPASFRRKAVRAVSKALRA